MSEIAIKVERLGKKYSIDHQKSGDFRNSLSNKFKSLFKKNEKLVREDFWALKDLNFEIRRGEAVGIIGRNGAGKSTLLKILSRITEPTIGRFEINGRVSSLLEVGTGFHPELTGRENIFLNGTIMGMRRSEIKMKQDEIVGFSGVEKFIDTPVKHYSSGMKVRLAFSVAAHLEPDIMIIDEVLAVGDAEFQKKCLGKMDEVSKKEGRTVIFVSHNMSAVQNLCQSGIYLLDGRIEFSGKVSDTLTCYMNTLTSSELFDNWTKEIRERDKPLEILEANLKIDGKQPNVDLIIETKLITNSHHKPSLLVFDILSEDNVPLFQAIPNEVPFINIDREGQVITSTINLPPLIPGNYIVSIWIGPSYSETFDRQKEILIFSIETSPVPERTYPFSKRFGYVIPKSRIVLQRLSLK